MEVKKSTRQKILIDSIRTKNSDYKYADQAIMCTNLLNRVSSDIYTSPERFLVEMIQNCDDSSFNYENCAMDLSINFFEKELMMTISHRGKPFDENDVRSICDAGNSTKINDEKATGYKGLGFKSAFANSSKLIILSNGYQFKFDKSVVAQEKWDIDIEEYKKNNPNITELIKPWQCIPIWIEKSEIDPHVLKRCGDFNVNFIVYFKNEHTCHVCSTFLFQLEQNHMFFLFLKSKTINFQIFDDAGLVSKYSKIQVQDDHENIVAIKNKDTVLGMYQYDRFEINLKDFLDSNKINMYLNNDFLPKKMSTIQSFQITFAIPVCEDKKTKYYKIAELPQEQRMIFAFLPTKVNYGFPFLINSNFLLDAGRTQLMEDEWNTFIFSILPHYINIYQQRLFRQFGNSYSNSLLHEYKITCKKFEEPFLQKYTEIKDNLASQGDVYAKTSSGKNSKLAQCFVNDFIIEGEPMIWSIVDFFSKVYRDDALALQIVEKFYFETNNSFIFSAGNEISHEDREYFHKLCNYYYHQDGNSINKEQLTLFIDSNTYREFYSNEVVYRFLYHLKDEEDIFKKLEKKRLFRDKDSMQMKRPKEFKISISNPNSDVSKIFLQGNLKKNEMPGIEDVNSENTQVLGDDKIELDPLLVKLFIDNQQLDILIRLGVTAIDEKIILEKILSNFDLYYDEHTSIPLIRLVFKSWLDVKGKKQKIIKSKINNVLQKKLLTKNNQFIHPHNLNIGIFYTDSDLWDSYDDYSVSEDYFFPESKKIDWVRFFKLLELWHEDKSFKLIYDKEKFSTCPFIDEEFKKANMKKFTKDATYNMQVSPFMNEIPSKSDKEIIHFFQKHFHLCDVSQCNVSEIGQKLESLNYFKWFFEKQKRIPTNKKTLLPPNQILSYSYLKENSIPKDIRTFLEKNLTFPFHKQLEEHLNYKFNTTLQPEEIIPIMDKLASFISSTRQSREEATKMKEYYLSLLVAISKLKNTIFRGYLLDTNWDFMNAKNLYFVQIAELKQVLRKKLDNQFKELLTEVNDTDIESYLAFCRLNGVRIYSEKDIVYTLENETEDKELKAKLKRILPIINKLMKNGNIAPLKSITFFSCTNIITKTYYSDLLEVDVCIYSHSQNRIIYICDDVYQSWMHPTILYKLTELLSLVVGEKGLHAKMITLFQLESNSEIDDFLKLSD